MLFCYRNLTIVLNLISFGSIEFAHCTMLYHNEKCKLPGVVVELPFLISLGKYANIYLHNLFFMYIKFYRGSSTS